MHMWVDANGAQDLENIIMFFGMTNGLESFAEVRHKCVTRDYDDIWDCSDVCTNCWPDLDEEGKEGYIEITEDALPYEWQTLDGRLVFRYFSE